MASISLSTAEINDLIPQRHPFLFVQSATVVSDDDIQGVCRWGADNPILAGHFPGFALVPAVLLIEASAQLAGIHIARRYPVNVLGEDSPIGVLTTIRRVTVHKPVFPEMDISYRIRLEAPVNNMFGVWCEASSGAGKVLRCDLVLAVVNKSRLVNNA